MEELNKNPEIIRRKGVSKDVIFYSQKGGSFEGFSPSLPLSRITLYKSGANRIQRKPDNPPPENKLKRRKHDIQQFSYNARRRYFDYVNSLNFDGFFVYRYDFTLSSHIEPCIKNREVSRSGLYKHPFADGITKEAKTVKVVNDLFIIRKKLLRYLSKAGFDTVYKIEYTLGCDKRNQAQHFKIYGVKCNYECYKCIMEEFRTPVPHFHLFCYTRDQIKFTSDYKHIDEVRKRSADFADICFNSLDIWNGRDLNSHMLEVHRNMSLASVAFSGHYEGEELRKKIFYLSFYFTKDKNYQNIIPEKYLGIKMWGYSRENYGDIRVEPEIVPITHNIYDKLYQEIKNDVIQAKKSRCKKASVETCQVCTFRNCEYFVKKNGVFSVNIDSHYNRLCDGGHFSGMLTEINYLTILKEFDNGI